MKPSSLLIRCDRNEKARHFKGYKLDTATGEMKNNKMTKWNGNWQKDERELQTRSVCCRFEDFTRGDRISIGYFTS